MEEKHYPIPPDLTIGDYIGGYTWLELGIIAVTGIIAIVALSSISLSFGVFLAAVPFAIAILCRRHDSGTGYTNAFSGLLAMLRYSFADLMGNMDFSLRKMLQLDKQELAEKVGENENE